MRDLRKSIETIHPTMGIFSTLKVLPDEGARTSSYCTSIGKIMVADMIDREPRRFFEDKPRQRFVSNTITDFKDMRKHLSIVRRECIAFDNEEYSLGVKSGSDGFRNSDGRTDGAIDILGSRVRLSRSRTRKLSPIVKDYALEISRELGYKGVM